MKIQRPKTKANQKAADDFMEDSGHQDHAEWWVKNDVGELKNMGKTKEEIIETLARKGHLKTETDRKILEGELQKQKVKEDPDRYRENKEKEMKHKQLTEGFIRQSQEDVAREQMEAIKNRPRRSYHF
uniref:Uncharacterized protein n=1 Tax=viral metagenome TaxID=1070528 RepID=A0A6H1ZKM5_9ZZZZ